MHERTSPYKKTNDFMLLVCIIYATCMNLVPFLGRTAEVIILFSIYVIFKRPDYKIFNDSLFRVALLSILVIIASWVNISIIDPKLAAKVPDLRYFLRLFLFIPIAYWLGGDTRNINIILLASATAIILSTFTRGDGLSEWLIGLHGERVDFKIINAQHTTFFMALILLGTITYYIPTIIKSWGKLSHTKKTVHTITILILFSLSFIGALISQTRGIWLALSISLLAIAVPYTFKFKKMKKKRIIATILIGILVLTTAILYSPLEKIIYQRIGVENNIFSQFISNGVDNLPYSSIGIRLHSWNEALKWVEARPIIGSGGLAKSAVIQNSNFPEEIKHNFRHLHNYYLETIVCYGFVGLFLLILIYIILSKNIISLWKQYRELSNLALYCMCAMVLFIFANLFESYNSMWSGWVANNVIFATIYSFHIHKKVE